MIDRRCKGKNRLGLLATAAMPAAMAFALISSRADAAVIISDTFTGTAGSSLASHIPDVYAPATGYLQNGGSNFNFMIDPTGTMAQLSVDEGAALATNISTPTTYSVSILFNDGNIGGADQADRGEGLGFFSSTASGTNGFHGDGNFDGITVSPGGVVNLISVTSNQTITTYATPYTVAGYSSTVNHTLSYTASTVTGLVSSILLDGSPIPLVQTSPLFTPASTADVGFTASANALGESATYDNFTVSASVPEPASLMSVALGGVMLLKRHRRAKID